MKKPKDCISDQTKISVSVILMLQNVGTDFVFL